MKFTETEIPDVYVVQPQVFGDHRGFFMESWSRQVFEEVGLLYDFVQDNHSSSATKGGFAVIQPYLQKVGSGGTVR